MQDYFEYANNFLADLNMPRTVMATTQAPVQRPMPNVSMNNTNINMNSNLNDMPLAMAYVPIQKYRELYEPEEALSQGTLFKELDKPFEGWKW